MSQELDFEVEDLVTGTAFMDCNAIAVTEMTPVITNFRSAAAPLGQFNTRLDNNPPDTKRVFVCVITDMVTPFAYATVASGNILHNLANNEGFFMRLYGTDVGTSNFDNATVNGYFFSDYESALAWEGPDDVTGGQWRYATSGVASFDAEATYKAVPLSYE